MPFSEHGMFAYVIQRKKLVFLMLHLISITYFRRQIGILQTNKNAVYLQWRAAAYPDKLINLYCILIT